MVKAAPMCSKSNTEDFQNKSKLKKLLFADDVILFAKCPKALQRLIDIAIIWATENGIVVQSGSSDGEKVVQFG